MVAYQADNTVTVRVREIAQLGGTIDALAGAGANRLYGIGFEVSEPRAALDAARREAVADARAKAELFAEAAGVTLGPVISIREGGMGGAGADARQGGHGGGGAGCRGHGDADRRGRGGFGIE